MSKATTAREKLEAKIASRNLEQITNELTLLDAMPYSAETAIVQSAYIREMDKRFSEVSEITWAIIEKHDVAFPDEYLSYPSALLLALDEIAKASK